MGCQLGKCARPSILVVIGLAVSLTSAFFMLDYQNGTPSSDNNDNDLV